jgi:hypothetical protein
MRSTVLWPHPTPYSTSSRTSPQGLYRFLRRMWACDAVRSLLFHRSLSSHSVLYYAGGFFGTSHPDFAIAFAGHYHRLHPITLHPFHGLRLTMTDSASSLCISALNEIHGHPLRTALCLTSLRHIRSPRCTGVRLPGSLVITGAGLAPASKR